MLQTMTVGELRVEYERVFGEEARSRNRIWLWRRIAWRIQEIEYGGLSDRAKARLEELMPDAELALRTPPGRVHAAVSVAGGPVRDKRIPKPGTVLLRHYKGQRLAVAVTKDGFEYDGRPFRSLSAVAREITGTHWNGLMFFGLTKKKAKK
jgi:hypothetical protein